MTTTPATPELSGRAEEQLRMLGQAAALLASSLELNDILTHTISACLPALGDFGIFDVIVDDGVRRTVRAHQDPEIETLLAATQWVRHERTDVNLCALTTGRPGLHVNLGDDWYRYVAVDDAHLALLRRLKFHSMLTVPMRYHGELVGALTLFMNSFERRHRAEDVEFAEELALLAAPVVVNARLLMRERASRAEAEAVRRRLELLAAASGVFSQSLDPHVTLKAVASLLAPRVADWCRVDLIDASGAPQPMLTHHAVPRLAQRGAELAQRWRASASIPGSVAWVVAHSRPALIGKITDRDLDCIGNPGITSALRELGIRASLCVPLVARDRTLGAISVAQAESGRTLTEDDLALITELAQKAALALDNARLYADAERARRDAEAANQAKDRFIAMLGHELRNPLAPIATALQRMELRGDRSTHYEQTVIARQVAHLSQLLDDLHDMSRIVSGKLELTLAPVEIAVVIGKSLELARPLIEERQLTCEQNVPSESLWLIADIDRLAQVFVNLLGNAAKFTPEGGHIGLTVSAADGMIEVAVRDSGDGVPTELLPHVFDQLMQGPQQSERQDGSLGLELGIAKTLVLMHGGSIRAESDGAGLGTTFFVRLPAAEKPT